MFSGEFTLRGKQDKRGEEDENVRKGKMERI